MVSLKEYASKEPELADYLPWAFIPAPGIVEHKDGSWQKTFRFRALDLDSATHRDLMNTAAQFNNAMRRLSDGWSIFIEAQRNADCSYPESSWPNLAAKLIDDERRSHFEGSGYFKNDY